MLKIPTDWYEEYAKVLPDRLWQRLWVLTTGGKVRYCLSQVDVNPWVYTRTEEPPKREQNGDFFTRWFKDVKTCLIEWFTVVNEDQGIAKKQKTKTKPDSGRVCKGKKRL